MRSFLKKRAYLKCQPSSRYALLQYREAQRLVAPLLQQALKDYQDKMCLKEKEHYAKYKTVPINCIDPELARIIEAMCLKNTSTVDYL